MKQYPDIIPILEAKEQRRKELANLPIIEKLKILETMREGAKVIKRARVLKAPKQ